MDAYSEIVSGLKLNGALHFGAEFFALWIFPHRFQRRSQNYSGSVKHT